MLLSSFRHLMHKAVSIPVPRFLNCEVRDLHSATFDYRISPRITRTEMTRTGMKKDRQFSHSGYVYPNLRTQPLDRGLAWHTLTWYGWFWVMFGLAYFSNFLWKLRGQSIVELSFSVDQMLQENRVLWVWALCQRMKTQILWRLLAY